MLDLAKESVMSEPGAVLEVYPQVLMARDPDIGAGVAAELLGNAKAAEISDGLFFSFDPAALAHNRKAALGAAVQSSSILILYHRIAGCPGKGGKRESEETRFNRFL